MSVQDDRARVSGGGRILVLVDASRPSLAALEAAAEIADRRGAELHALFIEETALLRSANLPFTREVGVVSGAARAFDAAEIEDRLRWQAGRVRRLLERLRTSRRIDHVFRVLRGSVHGEVLALAGPDDLLILGRVGWSAPARMLGSTARRLMRDAPGTVLLWCGQTTRSDGVVAVVVDDPAQEHAALDTARLFARESGRPLRVICPPLDDAEANSKRDRVVGTLLTGADVEATVVRPGAADLATLQRTLRGIGAVQLVLGRSSRLMALDGVEALLEDLSLPVTITR